MSVLQQYLVEDAGSYESTSRVESPGATYVQVSLVKRLQNSEEVSTLKLQREREREVVSLFCFITYIRQWLYYINWLNIGKSSKEATD